MIVWSLDAGSMGFQDGLEQEKEERSLNRKEDRRTWREKYRRLAYSRVHWNPEWKQIKVLASELFCCHRFRWIESKVGWDALSRWGYGAEEYGFPCR